jgi:hypothetical protein
VAVVRQIKPTKKGKNKRKKKANGDKIIKKQRREGKK